LPRYGIYDLIKAYEKTKPDYDLVIAGHGASLEPLNNPRIKFVGQVSKQTNYALQAHAAALINPRPYDLHLDAESVPSKMLEYLASGKPVISTLHSKLKELFPEEVNWVDGTLLDFFITHLDENRKLIGLKENHSQQKLEELYGLKTQGQRIYSFLQDLSSLSKESITLENSK
jgi:glycosyltransferase involved in cell wall biosynthesis